MELRKFSDRKAVVKLFYNTVTASMLVTTLRSRGMGT
ncbi:hypothetical protein JOD16_001341 [Enterococcus xiangfangensis]|nr:hypothetical protein [Enterococcus xiangfangensis]